MNYYNKFSSLLDQMKELYDEDNADTPFFVSWYSECLRAILRCYGDSIEYKIFTNIKFHSVYGSSSDIAESNAYYEGLEIARRTIKNFLDDFKEKNDINVLKERRNHTMETKVSKDKVFIVHGHDSSLKYRVSALLRKIGIDPIILHEKISSSDTIIEKLERYGAEAIAAVILFTPDDFGQAKTEEERKARARQNVVFEAGYFMGLLGRKNTIIVVTDKTIELPGDLSGVVYSDEKTVEINIAGELKAMGLPVDLNKLYE